MWYICESCLINTGEISLRNRDFISFLRKKIRNLNEIKILTQNILKT